MKNQTGVDLITGVLSNVPTSTSVVEVIEAWHTEWTKVAAQEPESKCGLLIQGDDGVVDQAQRCLKTLVAVFTEIARFGLSPAGLSAEALEVARGTHRFRKAGKEREERLDCLGKLYDGLDRLIQRNRGPHGALYRPLIDKLVTDPVGQRAFRDDPHRALFVLFWRALGLAKKIKDREDEAFAGKGHKRVGFDTSAAGGARLTPKPAVTNADKSKLFVALRNVDRLAQALALCDPEQRGHEDKLKLDLGLLLLRETVKYPESRHLGKDPRLLGLPIRKLKGKTLAEWHDLLDAQQEIQQCDKLFQEYCKAEKLPGSFSHPEFTTDWLLRVLGSNHWPRWSTVNALDKAVDRSRAAIQERIRKLAAERGFEP